MRTTAPPAAAEPRACAGLFCLFGGFRPDNAEGDPWRGPTRQPTSRRSRSTSARSNATVLTEYRGLTVAQLKTLRRSLGANANYAVVKNTLTKIAAKEAGVEGLDDLLAGPSAIAFIKGDPVEAAKGLRDFAKAHPLLVIKGGYMDGKTLSAAEIAKLADLESREVLLAKLAGAMKASLSQAAALFQAPLVAGGSHDRGAARQGRG